MGTLRIWSSRRGKQAIASIMALASVTIGGVRYINQVPDDIVLATTVLVKPWEGEKLKAYLDRIAKPPVWTICNGDTKNVRSGMVETPAGCKTRTENRLVRDFRPALVKCIKGFNSAPISWRAMMDSLAFNIGSGAACNSGAAAIVDTAMRKGKTPDYVDSCEKATAYNMAGGQFIVGLANRRGMGDPDRIGEGELCLSGLE